MEFDYIVADPTGNITVLVRSQYTAENRQQIINESFAKEPSCEQAGFIMPVSGKTIRLEMMGYEFCGHATLSAAAYLAHANGLKAGGTDTIMVDSSGADEFLEVSLKHVSDEPVYTGTVRMPVPEVSSFRGYPLVSFDGISHMIVPSDLYTDEQAESLIREYASELKVSALGMMLCDDYDELCSGRNEDAGIYIRPLVYVQGSDTLFWEHGCATGSTALGWYRYHLSGIASTEINQPGGTIHVDVTDGRPSLTATVALSSGRSSTCPL